MDLKNGHSLSDVASLHKPSSGELYPQLDGLRAIAIISVVLGHVMYFNPNAGTLQAILHAATKTGGMGVSIFFVLSGFLITQSLLRAGSTFDAYSYAVRRAAKIIPPFALTMLLFGGLIAAFGRSDGLVVSGPEQN